MKTAKGFCFNCGAERQMVSMKSAVLRNGQVAFRAPASSAGGVCSG